MSKKRKHQHVVAAELEDLFEAANPSTSRAELFEIVTQAQTLIAAAKLRKVEDKVDKVGMPSIPRSLH